jgi:hypothetical protein
MNNSMKANKRFTFLLLIISWNTISMAQPFADIASFNFQTFSGNYKDSSKWKNTTNNYFLNLFYPKEFKNGNTLLIRINSEILESKISGAYYYSNRLANISMPIGMKLVSENKKWESIILAVPKIASDFSQKINGYDWQYGAIVLQHFVPNPNLKIKAGIYYNKETFGDFFVPLLGVDWKVNKRLYMYGILPTSYKIELNLIAKKLYTGINLKYFTRSFRLSENYQRDYVRYDEGQVKLFVDYFVIPKFLVFADIGYSIGRNPWQYNYNSKEKSLSNPIYYPMQNYMLFNIGVAYRIRFDLDDKKAE